MKHTSNRNAFVLFSAAFSIFVFPFINLGFDQIHEGVNIGSALGLRNGAMIHRDILEMKGILFSIFLAIADYVGPFSPVLNMKLANVILLIYSSWFLYLLSRKYNDSFAKLAVLLWICVNPYVSNFTFDSLAGILFISNNNLTVAMILSSIYLYQLSFNYLSKQMFSNFPLLGTLVLLGLMPWVRIQNLFFSVTFFVWILYAHIESKWYRFAAAIIFFLAVFAPLFLLYFSGSLLFWFEQIFLYPIRLNSLHDSSTHIPISTLVKTFVICGFFFCLFSIVVFALRKYSNLAIALFSLVAISSVFSLVFSVRFPIDARKDDDPTNWVLIISSNWPLSWSRSALFLLIICATFCLTRIFVWIPNVFFSRILHARKISLTSFSKDFSELRTPNFLAGIQGAIFLYPNFGNLWEVTPLLILFLISHLYYLNSSLILQVTKLIAALLLGMSITGSIKAVQILNSPRYSYGHPLMQGLYETEPFKISDFSIIARSISKIDKTFQNECNLSLIPFLNEGYQSSSRYYVNFVYRKVSSIDPEGPDFVITCTNNPTEFDFDLYTLVGSSQLSDGSFIQIFKKS